MNNIPYIDILILAMVAIFIINKLRNTLGKKTGNEHNIADKFARRKSDLKESSPDKVSQAKDDRINIEKPKYIFHENPEVSSELSKIHKIDPSFKVDDFIVGAKKAFEVIITSFNKGDKTTLKGLVSKNVYNAFESAIDSGSNNPNSQFYSLLIKEKKAT